MLALLPALIHRNVSDAEKDMWKRVRYSQDVCFTGSKETGTNGQEGTLMAAIWKVMEHVLVEGNGCRRTLKYLSFLSKSPLYSFCSLPRSFSRFTNDLTSSVSIPQKPLFIGTKFCLALCFKCFHEALAPFQGYNECTF